jgi:hypothetical protein
MEDSSVELIHIDNLLYPIGNGVTVPILADSRGVNYVIKTYNNSQGNKILVNELLCYLIAKELELPIPNAKIGIIDNFTAIDNNVNDIVDFDNSCYGPCFCSQYLGNAFNVSSHKMLSLCDNYQKIICKIMLFDHLIYNKDRNKGNLLINSENKKREIYIIDHSHTFNLESIWSSASLEQKIDDKDFEDEWIMRNNGYLYGMFKSACKIDMILLKETVDFFKMKLSCDFFDKIIEEIPELWENNKSELIGVSKYLKYRLKNIDYYINLICNIDY